MFRSNQLSAPNAAVRILLTVLLTAIGVPVLVTSMATPASGAVVVSEDEDGANDEPGQKDLTRMTVDYGSPGDPTLAITFNWDEISWPGDNTGDACSLFDTDSDGKANYAICITVEDGPPAVEKATRLFSCNDSSATKCAGKVEQTISAGTTCAVQQSSDDPFPTGANAPSDTKASCTIVLADVGGTSSKLLNTCSYPSEQPNSDYSDCVLIPRDGFLHVVKVATPDDGTTFSFTLDDAPFGSTQGSGEFTVPVISDEPHDLAETVPNGWQLDSASCSNNDDPSQVQVASDATVTCTFNNSIIDLLPTATLTKTANPTSVAEPGGLVTYTIVIDNTSPEPESIDLTALTDNRFGDLLDDAGNNLISDSTCAAATITVAVNYSCSFKATVNGDATGATSSHTNVATATLNDDDGNTINPFDDATVTVTDVLPVVRVDKAAGVESVDEPGDDVDYTVTVHNDSVEAVTLTVLTDDKFGDLRDDTNSNVSDNTCDDDATVTIAAASSFTCTFTGHVAGNAGDDHTNIVTGTIKDNEDNTDTDTGTDTVLITDVAPTIVTLKTADPTEVDEPGGQVTYSVKVTNSSFEAVTLTDLTDDKFGDILDPLNTNINGTTCVDNTVIPAAGDYSCTFTADVTGDAGFVHTNTITATTIDDDGTTAAANDDADVTVLDVLPDVDVTKDASPTSVPESGGLVTYTVDVENDGVETVTLTSLTDDVFGDLRDDTNSNVTDNTCDDAAIVTIAAGDTFTCTFKATISGNAGTSHTNTVTGAVKDNEDNEDTDFDDADVTFSDVLPTVVVDKSADTDSVSEPGDTVEYTVDVQNTSFEAVTITVLSDDKFGDLLDDAGNDLISGSTCTAAFIPAGDTYTCTFTAFVGGEPGTHTNVVTGTVIDDDQSEATDYGQESVDITDVLPVVRVDKSASVESVDEPGADVDYTVTVHNDSVEAVTLTVLTDDKFGDLLDDGGNDLISESSCTAVTIEAGASFTCSFTAKVAGEPGTHTNVVTGTVMDNDENTASDVGQATVDILDVEPTIALTKTASRPAVLATGGAVKYTVTVENTSFEPVTLMVLTDDKFGDLLDDEGNDLIRDSTCASTVIEPGTTYSCAFLARVTGTPDIDHVNVVTGTVIDNDDSTVTETADETVRILPDEILGAVTPRPPVTVIPETGAPWGMRELTGLGLLLVLAGAGALSLGRRTARQ